MTQARLVALTVGEKKTGGKWYKATLKVRNSKGIPQVQDFFLSPEVGASAERAGLIEDVDVNIDLGFDDYMRTCITSLTKSAPTTKSSSNTTLGGI